ncbi:glycoside hydrolase superfamily [Aspergillus multicolor]|uniref:glycoside hydrolase family 3 protein n=1 Tax=Aspergillus multicolor TaxID=41759 RepID=UPI003CCD6243
MGSPTDIASRGILAWTILYILAAYLIPPTAAETQPWLNTSYTPEDRLQSFLSALTFEEKLAMVQGNESAETNACIGYIPPLPRLGMPAICMGDGPEGVGNNLANVTTFPAPILTVATWNKTLNNLFGSALGAEHKSKGRNVVLAPTINIIRTPLWGRAAESMSEDPYLTSKMAVEVTRGIQENKVVACVKHFAAYNQETDRFGLAPEFDAVDAVVEERVLREIYFPAFKASIQEGNAGSVMCAYNKLNGQHACENSWLLNDVLKNEWEFNGFVVTDWYFAQRSTVQAALAGLDNSQPGGDWTDYYGFPDFFGSLLEDAVGNGSVPRQRVEDMAERLWRPVFETGAVDSPSSGLAGIDVVARTQKHLDLAQEIVEEGAVLLKNEGVLPLGQGKEKTIAVFGAGAADQAAVTELHGGFVLDTTMVVQKPVDYIRARAKQDNITVLYSEAYPGTNEFPTVPSSMFGSAGLNVTYWTSTDFSGFPNRTVHADNITAISYPADIGAVWPEVFSSRYEGTFYPNVSGRYHFSLSGNGGGRLYLDNKLVADMPGSNFGVVVQGVADLKADTPVPIRFDYSMGYSVDPGTYGISVGVNIPTENPSLYEHAIATAEAADVSIVFVNDAHTEGLDSSLAMRLPGDQDEIISLIASQSRKTIVVLNTNAAILMPWLDSVDAVIETFYPGQQVGSAIARLLFGDVNFSGKLPVTFPASYEDSPTSNVSRFPGVNLTATYSEGLYVGYKWFDEFGVTPLFAFGHGLSYTSFEIGELAIVHTNSTSISTSTSSPGSGDADVMLTITTTITNTGPVFGKEVVQLYVRFPEAADEPPKLLRGFEKVALDVDDTAAVGFDFSREDLVIWNTEVEDWVLVPGVYGFLVGRSSGDIVQEVDVELP